VRILICGDRHWTDRGKIRQYLRKLPAGTIIIEGEAQGADTLARLEAEELGLTVVKYPADWEQYGRAAGPIRNSRMLTEGKPDRVVVFHDSLSTSRGTKNMVDAAEKAGVEVEVIGHNAHYFLNKKVPS
jgi:hypothetical protein